MKLPDLFHQSRLLEGNQSDRFIHRLADVILQTFAERAPAQLRDRVNRYKKWYSGEELRNPQFLGRLDLGEMESSFANLTAREKLFFQHQAKTTIGFQFEQPGYIAAYNHDRPYNLSNSILVRLPDTVMDALVTPILKRKRLRPADVLAALSTRRSELVHELRHAYDDAASAGKFRHNARTAAAEKAQRERSPQATALYFNDPVEISARLTAALGHHQAALAKPFAEFAALVMRDFGRWKELPAADRRQLLKRIASFYAAHEQTV
jgi:hypothetical protein